MLFPRHPVIVPAHAKIQGKRSSRLPIVLEKTAHFPLMVVSNFARWETIWRIHSFLHLAPLLKSKSGRTVQEETLVNGADRTGEIDQKVLGARLICRRQIRNTGDPLYGNSPRAEVHKRHSLRSLLALAGTKAHFDTTLERVLPSSPTECIRVLIQGRRLHPAAHGISNDVVGEGQRTGQVWDSVCLRKTVNHRLTDVDAVISGISSLTPVPQAEAKLVY